MGSHEEITNKMNDKRERESIDLACQILEHRAGDRYMVLKPYGKKVAGSKEEIEIFSDDGDIILVNRQSLALSLVEVKRLGENNFMKGFTDRKSWSLPNFIIDGVWQVQHKKLPIYAYLCFNAPMSYVAIIRRESTAHCWEIETKAGNGGKKDYFVVDPDLVDFKEVKELLK